MNKESIELFERFLASLPYAGLLYVAATEEHVGGYPEKIDAAYREIEARDNGSAYQCQHFNPHKGDWRPLHDVPERPVG